LLENWVFLVTNLLLIINALLGEWVTLRNRRRAPSSQAAQKTAVPEASAATK
jgi:hypothetical protein